jgi:hypothetical protein
LSLVQICLTLFMRIKLLLILPLVAVTLHSKAQVEAEKNTIKIYLEAGPAIPLQDFAEKNIDGGGYALTGFNLGAGVHFPLNKQLSIGLNYRFAKNPVDDLEFLQFQLPVAINYTINTGEWTSHLFLGGIRWEKELDEGLSFQLEPLAGAVLASSPAVGLGFGGLGLSIQSVTGSTFAYGGQIGLRKALANGHGLSLRTSFIAASPPPFSVRLAAISIGGLINLPPQQTEFDTKFALLSFNIGWEYRIGRK